MKDLCRVAELLESKTWTFAKTMPNNPHCYTVRNRWERDEDFVFVVTYMRENGYDGYWWKQKYRYFDLNEHTYWTMGAPINNPDGTPLTIIINRKKRFEQKEYMSQYDDISLEYDDYFCSPKFLQETRQVIDMLPKSSGRILDIGCGAGTLIDFSDISPQNYVGLDPSKKMIEALLKKHPLFHGSTVCSRFESFCLGKFDVIVSLFGSISYVDPAHLRKVPQMLNEGGRFFLMFYADDYEPVTHKQFNINPHIFRGAQNELPGHLFRFGNYDILTNYEFLPEHKRI